MLKRAGLVFAWTLIAWSAPTGAFAADPPLIVAAKNGDTATVNRLLVSGGNPDTPDEYKLTALNWAAYSGHLAAAQALVEHRATVDAHGNAHGWTPLMNAAGMGHPDVAAYLVAHGADVNMTTPQGLTPLMYAAANGHDDVVVLLLDHGAAIDAADGENETAFAKAKEGKQDKTASLLLARGADPTIPPRTGLAPKFLCKAGVGLDLIDPNWKWEKDAKSGSYYCSGGTHDLSGGTGEILMYTFMIDGTQRRVQQVYIEVGIFATELPKRRITDKFAGILKSVLAAAGNGDLAATAIQAVSTLSDTEIDMPPWHITAKFRHGEHPNSYNGSAYTVWLDVK